MNARSGVAFGIALVLLAAGSALGQEFRVAKTIATGAAPHGMQREGGRLYLAASGGDRIERIDLAAGEVDARWPVGGTPLDLVRSGDGWLVTQFGERHLIALGPDGAATGQSWDIGRGPSLFAPRRVDERAYVVSEFADRLTVFDTETRHVITSYPTGARPYPAAVSEHGILAFVPNHDAGTVSVIDLLNDRVIRTLRVCDRPSGGALTRNDVAYLVACRGDDRIMAINTASFAVTGAIADGIGPGPFSVAVEPYGRFAFANNADGESISVFDPEGLAPIARIEVGAKPIVLRIAGGDLFVASEGANTVSVVPLPPWRNPDATGEPNEVVLLGTIHGTHRTSERYSLETLERTIREIDPDIVLTEIPPNRLEAALRGFETAGRVTERRVSVFPEYTDVLFPLTRELDFRILPAAAWSAQMNQYRSRMLARIRNDPEYRREWAAHMAARRRFARALGERSDDPLFIHTRRYDEITREGFGAYDRHFNDMLGPGGWTNINEAHYALIEEALDRHRGEGKRILITFGSSHKYWFLDRLRAREDIRLLDPKPFLRAAAAR